MNTDFDFTLEVAHCLLTSMTEEAVFCYSGTGLIHRKKTLHNNDVGLLYNGLIKSPPWCPLS